MIGLFIINVVQCKRKHKLLFIYTSSVSEEAPENYLEWMRAINDSLDKEVEEDDYTNPYIHQLFELIEQDQITPEERARMKDEYSQAELKKEGFDEGKEIGFDEGYREAQEEADKKIREAQENLIKTASKLKALGIADEQIASTTGLNLEQVRML